jgi:hypothetical protein
VSGIQYQKANFKRWSGSIKKKKVTEEEEMLRYPKSQYFKLKYSDFTKAHKVEFTYDKCTSPSFLSAVFLCPPVQTGQVFFSHNYFCRNIKEEELLDVFNSYFFS